MIHANSYRMFNDFDCCFLSNARVYINDSSPFWCNSLCVSLRRERELERFAACWRLFCVCAGCDACPMEHSHDRVNYSSAYWWCVSYLGVTGHCHFYFVEAFPGKASHRMIDRNLTGRKGHFSCLWLNSQPRMNDCFAARREGRKWPAF